MAYTKQTWADGSAGGTPINAARLTHMEDGIEAAASAAEGGGTPATTSAAGIVELATTAESQAGTDAVRASTPVGVKAAIDQRIDNTTGLGSSTTNAPSQAAAKAYADGLLDANNAYQYKGVIDASANPNYPAASAGHTYKISVAGKIGGASGPNVEVGDSVTCLVDSSATGTQAAVGANWIIVQTNIDGAVVGPASSVASRISTFSGTTGKVIQDSGATISIDGTLVSNSDAKVPTEKAVKTAIASKTLAPVGAVFTNIYTGSAWPARPTSRTDVTVFYIALAFANPIPTDFVAGVDFLLRPPV